MTSPKVPYSSLILALCIAGCHGTPAPTSSSSADAQSKTPVLAELVSTGAGQERCRLPPKTDVKQATVVVRVMVLPDGTPQYVEVTRSSSMGEGFEAAARKCALNYRYRPARDASGKMLREWTHEFNITFVEIDEATATSLTTWGR